MFEQQYEAEKEAKTSYYKQRQAEQEAMTSYYKQRQAIIEWVDKSSYSIHFKFYLC